MIPELKAFLLDLDAARLDRALQDIKLDVGQKTPSRTIPLYPFTQVLIPYLTAPENSPSFGALLVGTAGALAGIIDLMEFTDNPRLTDELRNFPPPERFKRYLDITIKEMRNKTTIILTKDLLDRYPILLEHTSMVFLRSKNRRARHVNLGKLLILQVLAHMAEGTPPPNHSP